MDTFAPRWLLEAAPGATKPGMELRLTFAALVCRLFQDLRYQVQPDCLLLRIHIIAMLLTQEELFDAITSTRYPFPLAPKPPNGWRTLALMAPLSPRRTGEKVKDAFKKYVGRPAS